MKQEVHSSLWGFNMSLTNDQLLDRIELIEATLNDVQTALNNLASKAQLKALLNIRQSEINTLQAQVTELQTQIVALQTFHE